MSTFGQLIDQALARVRDPLAGATPREDVLRLAGTLRSVHNAAAVEMPTLARREFRLEPMRCMYSLEELKTPADQPDPVVRLVGVELDGVALPWTPWEQMLYVDASWMRAMGSAPVTWSASARLFVIWPAEKVSYPVTLTYVTAFSRPTAEDEQLQLPQREEPIFLDRLEALLALRMRQFEQAQAAFKRGSDG